MQVKPTSPAYRVFLEDIKDRVRRAQVGAALAANRELIRLYWEIGREILTRQRDQGWGAKIIDLLASDLRRSFPGLKGFSARNLKYMRAFAEAWPEEAFVQQAAAQMPWFHNCVLLEKVKSPENRRFYIQQTLQYGWSRNILVAQIESGLHQRQGKAITNFDRTLPEPSSELARQTLKDPYLFDFLELAADARERALERALVEHIRAFLLELGVGFAFVGHQVHLEVGGEDFYLDMLFYHLRLRCFVVIDLKSGDFRPEYAGKMNFYLSAVDDRLRQSDLDGPTIGLLLCKSRNRIIVEYALRDTVKPIGVAEWHLTRSLPDDLSFSLPSAEDLEAELADSDAERSNDCPSPADPSVAHPGSTRPDLGKKDK